MSYAQLPSYGQQRQALTSQLPTSMYGPSLNNVRAHDWSGVDFGALYEATKRAQAQTSTNSLAGYTALPFPPAHLLAMYPPEYQQELLRYYQEVRRVYPDLYRQYVQYYETYYQPLYFPPVEQPSTYSIRAPTPPPVVAPPVRAPAPQPKPAPVVRPVAPAPVTPAPAPPPPPPPAQLERQPSTSSVGSLQRQSSIRRQNSFRRVCLLQHLTMQVSDGHTSASAHLGYACQGGQDDDADAFAVSQSALDANRRVATLLDARLSTTNATMAPPTPLPSPSAHTTMCKQQQQQQRQLYDADTTMWTSPFCERTAHDPAHGNDDDANNNNNNNDGDVDSADGSVVWHPTLRAPLRNRGEDGSNGNGNNSGSDDGRSASDDSVHGVNVTTRCFGDDDDDGDAMAVSMHDNDTDADSSSSSNKSSSCSMNSSSGSSSGCGGSTSSLLRMDGDWLRMLDTSTLTHATAQRCYTYDANADTCATRASTWRQANVPRRLHRYVSFTDTRPPDELTRHREEK